MIWGVHGRGPVGGGGELQSGGWRVIGSNGSVGVSFFIEGSVQMTQALAGLREKLVAGEISRREFAQGAAALGLSASMVSLIVNNTSAQTPEASPAASPVDGEPLRGSRPDAGTEG